MFIALGVAAAVSAAVVLGRRRRDYSYVPGRAITPNYPPLPPVVRQMHHSYQRSHPAIPPHRHTAGPPPAGAGNPPPTQPSMPVPIGDRLDHAMQVDLHAAPALAVDGPRAADVARALLAALLTRPPGRAGDQPARVLLTAADAAYLLGHRPDRLPPALRIVGDLDAALDELRTQNRPSHRPQPVTLIARPPHPGSPTAHRLQAILTSRPANVCVVILGPWPARLNIVTDAHGVIQTAGEGLPAGLQGVQLYTLPAAQARDLIATLAPPPPAPLPQDHYPDPAANPAADFADELPDTSPDHTEDRPAAVPVEDDDTIQAGLTRALTTVVVPPEPSKTPDLPRQRTPHEPTHTTSTAEPSGTPLHWTPTGHDTTDEPACDLSEQKRELLTYLAIHPTAYAVTRSSTPYGASTHPADPPTRSCCYARPSSPRRAPPVPS